MSWKAVAKKEYLENVRNYWVIGVSALFLVLTIVASLLGGFRGGGRVNLSGITATIVAMQLFASFFVPVIALMLGFSTIAGERESGSLSLLVAQPLTRGEIFFGKFLGLWGVLATTMVTGFGVAGLVILARTTFDATGLADLGIFLLDTLAWGAAWVSVSVLISSLFKRRGTAIAGAIITWFFFSVIWSIAVTLLLFATVGTTRLSSGDIPSWYSYIGLLNPDSVYSGLLQTTLSGYRALVGSVTTTTVSATDSFLWIFADLAWIGVPLAVGYSLFQSRDI